MIVLNVPWQALVYGKTLLRLQPAQVTILKLLAQSAPNPARHDKLRIAASNADCSSNVVTVQISYLRRNLRNAGIPLQIVAMHKIGYFLRGDIHVEDEETKTVKISGAVSDSIMALLSSHPDVRESNRVMERLVEAWA